MKKKIVLALLAAVLLVAAVAALIFAVNKDTVEISTTDVVTVVEESTAAPESAEAETQAETEAMSEETEDVLEIVEFVGAITEVTDEYVLIDAGDMGPIQANISDDVLIEGVEELAVGQTAVIKCDGKMTRSIPAQITALHIGVYEVKGTVTAVEEGRVTIINDEGGDEVVLTLPDNAPALAVGDAITAYTTGVSTMSLPPQMNAASIVK